MQYGNKSIKGEKLYLYQGFNPASVNFPPNNVHIGGRMDVVNQRDAQLVFLWQMVSADLGRKQYFWDLFIFPAAL
jgi:legumain